MWAEVQVAINEPVGDHDSERMLGTSNDGFADVDSEKRTGFRVLKTFGKASFLSGFERIGAMATERKTADLWSGKSLSYSGVSIARCCCYCFILPCVVSRSRRVSCPAQN